MRSLLTLLVGCLAATPTGAAHSARPAFELDHVILVVAPGAREPARRRGPPGRGRPRSRGQAGQLARFAQSWAWQISATATSSQG